MKKEEKIRVVGTLINYAESNKYEAMNTGICYWFNKLFGYNLPLDLKLDLINSGNLKNVIGYWFPCDYIGYKQRIDLLKRYLKQLQS